MHVRWRAAVQGSAPSFQLVEAGSLFLSLNCVLQASRPKAHSPVSASHLAGDLGSQDPTGGT